MSLSVPLLDLAAQFRPLRDVPSYAFFGTAGCVHRLGATPVFVEIAARAGIPVVEDAAQAIGARYGDRQAGAFGRAACFSFFPSKNLGAFGDGGLLTTRDAALAHEARLLRNHGMEPKYFNARVGGNFRLDALQASPRRDGLREHLTANGIGTEIYYPVPLHRQECFAGGPEADCPASDAAAATSLALPIYGDLTSDQQRHVVTTIAEFYGAT